MEQRKFCNYPLPLIIAANSLASWIVKALIISDRPPVIGPELTFGAEYTTLLICYYSLLKLSLSKVLEYTFILMVLFENGSTLCSKP